MSERRELPIIIKKFGVRQKALRFSDLSESEKKLYCVLGRLLRVHIGKDCLPLHIRMDLLTLMRLYQEEQP